MKKQDEDGYPNPNPNVTLLYSACPRGSNEGLDEDNEGLEEVQQFVEQGGRSALHEGVPG